MCVGNRLGTALVAISSQAGKAMKMILILKINIDHCTAVSTK